MIFPKRNTVRFLLHIIIIFVFINTICNEFIFVQNEDDKIQFLLLKNSTYSNDKFNIYKETNYQMDFISKEIISSIDNNSKYNQSNYTHFTHQGSISGMISKCDIRTEHLTIGRKNDNPPILYEFVIPPPYKHFKIDIWYASIVINFNSVFNYFNGLGHNEKIIIPKLGSDYQLFCKPSHHDDYIKIGTSTYKNSNLAASSYVPIYGTWGFGLFTIPNEDTNDNDIEIKQHNQIIQINGALIEIIENIFFGVQEFYGDITMHPGIQLDIPDLPREGCEDVSFKLTWENTSLDLGFTLIDPRGYEIMTNINEINNAKQIHINRLDGYLLGENYTMVVYSYDSIQEKIDFTIEYSYSTF